MISIERLRVAVGLDESDGSKDLALTDLLNGALAFISTQTNRYFGERAQTRDYLQGIGIRQLYLRSIPYAGSTSDPFDVAEQKAPDLNVTSLDPVAADGYELRRGLRNAWLMRRGGYFWRWGYEYVVDYEHGYDVDGLPKDIEDLVFGLIKGRYQLTDLETLKSETLGQYSYTRFSAADVGLAADLNDTIEAWRDGPVLA